MKQLVIIFTLYACLLSFGNIQAQNSGRQSNATKKDRVEVLYFYGKQRCATCMAIEQNTKELINMVFADEVKNGELIFKAVDIDKNEALADKYEITWSSLVVVDYNNGKAKAENITEFAFENAYRAPEKFKSGLKEKLKKLLNN